MAADPSNADTLVDAIKFLAPLIGGGGLTAMAVAFIGSRRPPRLKEQAQVPPPAVPIQIETPWMVQNLLEIKLEVEGIKRAVDGMSTAVSNMAIQVNTMAAVLKRRSRD